MKPVLKHLSSFQIIILGFIVVIFIGALLLMLPFSSKNNEVTPFLDALFTSTSATCVTGLVVYDTATHWSIFGQVIILILIQIGGMGVVTFLAVLATFAGRKIGLMQRSVMQEAVAAQNVGGIVRLTKFIVKTTIIIESVGAIIMMPVFCDEFGWKGIWYSIFHSISAFCNAGFDIMGTKEAFSSLTSYASQPIINIVIMLLIIIGGIGFLTWEDICVHRWHVRRYRVQTKIILIVTSLLIFIPAIYFFFFEFNDYKLSERIWSSLFQAVSPRTAGFNTVDITKISQTGIVISIVLMFIGGSPGSTAGGIKTTTIAVLLASTFSVFKRKDDTNILGRRISNETVKNASAIFLLYGVLAVFVAALMCRMENLPLLSCLYESISAIATVGLSLGITPHLNAISHILLMVLMFIGRIGGLTIIYATLGITKKATFKYPVGKITVG